jgi:hypothetical protein
LLASLRLLAFAFCCLLVQLCVPSTASILFFNKFLQWGLPLLYYFQKKKELPQFLELLYGLEMFPVQYKSSKRID